MKFNDANVVITGGASGIGRLMGRMALERGARKLIIWDINAQNIEIVRSELAAKAQSTAIGWMYRTRHLSRRPTPPP